MSANLKSYTVADVADVSASTEPFPLTRLAIVVKADGKHAWVSFVRRDGDHGGLMHKVNLAALRNVRAINLLA